VRPNPAGEIVPSDQTDRWPGFCLVYRPNLVHAKMDIASRTCRVSELLVVFIVLLWGAPALGGVWALWTLDDSPGIEEDIWAYDDRIQVYEALASSDFTTPIDLEFGPGGRLWIVEDAPDIDDDIWRYDFDTGFYETLPGSYFDPAIDIEFAADGTLWILEDAADLNEDIWSFDFATEFYEALPTSDFGAALDIEFDSDGVLWILDDSITEDV